MQYLDKYFNSPLTKIKKNYPLSTTAYKFWIISYLAPLTHVDLAPGILKYGHARWASEPGRDWTQKNNNNPIGVIIPTIILLKI
jgi:hypothetical protein